MAIKCWADRVQRVRATKGALGTLVEGLALAILILPVVAEVQVLLGKTQAVQNQVMAALVWQAQLQVQA